jgi:hypothetical protein
LKVTDPIVTVTRGGLGNATDPSVTVTVAYTQVSTVHPVWAHSLRHKNSRPIEKSVELRPWILTKSLLVQLAVILPAISVSILELRTINNYTALVG